MRCLLYGANGKVGTELTEWALRKGYRPILGGRTEAHLRPLAERWGLAMRCFDPERPGALRDPLSEVDLVLHVAGPTGSSLALLRACVERGIHYLDIGVVAATFAEAYRLHGKARESGSVVVPGVGLDIVFGDCLLAHLVAPSGPPRTVILAYGPASDPPWAAPFFHNLLLRGGTISVDGQFVAVPTPQFRHVHLASDGSEQATLVGPLPLAELASATHGYHASRVETYYLPPREGLAEGLKAAMGQPETSWGPWLQSYFQNAQGTVDSVRIYVEAQGPAEGARKGVVYVPTHVSVDGERGSITAFAAFRAWQYVMEQQVAPGVWTPAQAFGKDFGLDIPGVNVTMLA